MAGGATWGTAIMMIATNAYCAEKQSGGKMVKHSKMTKEEAQAFIREIMGPPHTDLAGKEYEEVRLMLALLKPYKETNNQHCWTDYYKIGDIEYHVTTWPDGEPPTIAEYLPEENPDKY